MEQKRRKTDNEEPELWVQMWRDDILSRLDRINEDIKRSREVQDDTNKSVSQMRADIAVLNVKSGLWGAVAGCITALGFFLFNLLTKK